MRAAGIAVSLLGALALAGGPARSAESSCAANARELYYPCASCHGDRGEGSEPFAAPALAGLDASYIRAQLVLFQRLIRGAHPLDSSGQEMTLMARTLRDPAAVEAVACYAASLPASTRPRPTFKGNLRRGRQLFAACSACHGARAEGNDALHAPSLRPLADWYLRRQLELFRLGVRGAHPDDVFGQQMRASTSLLSGPNDSVDLAAYISRLP